MEMVSPRHHILPSIFAVCILICILCAGSFATANRVAGGAEPVAQLIQCEDMTLIWSEDFEDRRANDWKMEKFSQEDFLGIIGAPHAYRGWGYSLHAASAAPVGGCGYIAESPDLHALGLRYQQPHVIRYRYKAPREAARGTFVSCMRGVKLALTDATPTATHATLGWVENGSLRFNPTVDLKLGVWHLVELIVDPHGAAMNFTMYVDGEYVGRGSTQCGGINCKIRVMDLPYDIIDGIADGRDPGAFGCGYWDNFEVWSSPEIRPEGPDIADDGVMSDLVYPNPLNPNTTILFELPNPGWVQVDIYALNGRLVRRLCDEWMAAGPQRVPWNGCDRAGQALASGNYRALLTTPEGVRSLSLTLLR